MGEGHGFTEGVQLRRDLLELSESLRDGVALRDSVSSQPIDIVSSRYSSLERSERGSAGAP
jgi:hypothetical protein